MGNAFNSSLLPVFEHEEPPALPGSKADLDQLTSTVPVYFPGIFIY